MLAYEAAADQTLSREDLDEMLDRLGGAAERQRAIRDLPMARNRLAKNLASLPATRARLAQAQAQAEAHIAQASANRRNAVPPFATDVNAVKGAADMVMVLEQTIETDRLAIAYYEAVIARRDPPDPARDAPEPEPDILFQAAAE